MRQLKGEVGVVSKADGSTLFEMCNTRVMVAVYGPREICPCFLGQITFYWPYNLHLRMYVANRASDKISQLTDNVYVCRSGTGQQVLRPIHSRKMVKIEHCDEGDATSASASAPRSGTIDPQQLDPTLAVVKAEKLICLPSNLLLPLSQNN
ncbi:Exosome complex exonuclease RRP41 [Hordeum vulgare]|nr:Exosome complex exonuclease RRP41 [Hordeum vulgare]